jgi:glutamate-ammonia-ligase adenylyltransferase
VGSFQKKFNKDSIGKLVETLLQPGGVEVHARAFGDHRFSDPEKAALLWEKLLPAGFHPATSRVRTLFEEIVCSPDRDMALLNLGRFAESTISPSRFLDSIYLEPPPCHLLVLIFSCSQYLTDILIRNPGYLSWLIEGGVLDMPKSYSSYMRELRDHIAPFEDHRRRINSIKRYKRRELLRIGARDLLGLAGVEEVTAELSLLTDAIVETVSRLSFRRELGKRAGCEDPDRFFEGLTPYRRFAVVSMGKLGGYELNYSSDIDLLFVSDVEERGEEYRSYSALARSITADLSSPTEEGTLYRVDLRLRPDGESGPLVVTVNDHINYLQMRAKPWEKQALLKARFTAGNSAVADEFLENCHRLIFGTVVGIADISEIYTMRERALRSLSGRERETNIKLMRGGIRDIEFMAQALELVHGRARSEVRSRNTLETLERLHHFGLLGDDEWTSLSDIYRFYRTVEHRLQLFLNVQTHTIPTSDADLARLGARVAHSALDGYDGESFRPELGRAIVRIRELYDQFFTGRPPEEIPLILSLPAGAREVRQVLDRYGIEDAERAHRHLSSLVYGDFPDLEGPETLQSATRSLPVILDGIGGTSAPELTLKNLVTIVKATGAVRSTLDLLADSEGLFRLLMVVSSLSTLMTDVLSRRIELLDKVAAGIPPAERPADGPEGVSNWYEESLLHIHIHNPFPRVGPGTLGPLLSGVAERVIERLFDMSGGGEVPVALFALGSLAVRESHCGSDLDLVAVGGEGFEPADCADMIRRMIELGRSTRGISLDLRLRGEGDGSPLVQGLDTYRAYFEHRASFWEFVAFGKRRFICGHPETGRAFEQLLRRRVKEGLSSAGLIDELRSARGRLESLSEGVWDVKHAAGGLYDLDFLAATVRGEGEGHVMGLDGWIGLLAGKGLLGEGEGDILRRAYALYYLIEHAAAHHGLHYPPLPERIVFFERYLGALLRQILPGGESFPEGLARTKRSVREIFDRFCERWGSGG